MSGPYAKIPNVAPLVCPQCNVSVYYCPCTLARIEGFRQFMRKKARAAAKPRARLIKAFSVHGPDGSRYPSVDTWMVHRALNGRIVRGYGYSLEGACRDYMQMLTLARKAFLSDPERWRVRHD